MDKSQTNAAKPSRAKAHVTVHIYGTSPDARYYTVKYRGRRLGGQFETREALEAFIGRQGLVEAT